MRAMRRVLPLVGAVLCLLAAPPGPAVGAADVERSCLWAVEEDPNAINIMYPDAIANYWGTPLLTIPPGGEIVLRGRFPHARYMSFHVYNTALQPTDALADVDIVPDRGSKNPFRAGARRTSEKRSYTVRIVAGTPPAERAPNTIYLNANGQAAQQGGLIYRLYIPDTGRDATGDTGVPEAFIRLPDGTETPYPAVCGAVKTNAPPALADLYAEMDGLPAAPVSHPAQNPIRWEVFFNFFYTQASLNLTGTPAEPAVSHVPADKSGGYLSNVHNAYAYAVAHRSFGPVLVMEGRAPTFPRTRDGQAVMKKGQVRYWSICENERHSTRFVACIADEDVVVDRKGRFTVVMSLPDDRPANARPECGVNWLPWGASAEGFPILRHMLPSPNFAHALQRVDEPGEEEAVAGEYLPTGRHMTRAEFEQRGC